MRPAAFKAELTKSFPSSSSSLALFGTQRWSGVSQRWTDAVLVCVKPYCRRWLQCFHNFDHEKCKIIKKFVLPAQKQVGQGVIHTDIFLIPVPNVRKINTNTVKHIETVKPGKPDLPIFCHRYYRWIYHLVLGNKSS